MTTNYMSKAQIRNILVKEWGKFVMSRELKGRVCYESSSGFMLKEAEDGFVNVYYNRTVNFRNPAASLATIASWNDRAAELLVGLGFERDGKNYRKAR
jgi:hypothetical protein